jgi:hypothetical protein
METEKKSNLFLFPNHEHGIYEQTDKQMLQTLSCDVNRDSARLPGDVTKLSVRSGQ